MSWQWSAIGDIVSNLTGQEIEPLHMPASNDVLLTLPVNRQCKNIKSKTNLHYTHGIMPKRVRSGTAYLRSLAPELHSSEGTSQ